MINVNVQKIIGNFLVAFATSFMAVQWVGGMDALTIALINALIYGALSVGKEMQGIKYSKKKKPLPIHLLDKATIF